MVGQADRGSRGANQLKFKPERRRNVHRHNHVAWAVAFVLGAGAAFTAVDGLAATVPVTLTQVGAPTWRLTDFHLFSAPGATDEQLSATFNAVFPRHGDHYLPHTNHATEVEEGLAAAGTALRLEVRGATPQAGLL
jgi:hypothetical protein